MDSDRPGVGKPKLTELAMTCWTCGEMVEPFDQRLAEAIVCRYICPVCSNAWTARGPEYYP